MKIPCKSIFLALLLLAGATGAIADPGRGGGSRQDDGQQGYAAGRDREMPRNERACPGVYGCEPGGANGGRAAPRGNGRMTPEERSALRRQINEAGQDIYSGKYRR